jgi:hypothetical protein
MTVGELIARLSEVPDHWIVAGTHKGSIEAWERPEGPGARYCYVFPDGRPTRFYTQRR